ncbi:MAG: tyrosine-type recombinase/integrase [Proteobacteria bacterium]|nr:tyrosine-type recombinase/integrase [Pseudomonadota bacterium]
MRWVDPNLTDGVWTTFQTKAGVAQKAMIPTILVGDLIERQKSSNSPWVFPSPSKSGYVEKIKKAWDTVWEHSGLHDPQARDLRRTLASWVQNVNVPIAAVQEQLGHASVMATAKHYTEINQTVQRAALDATVKSMMDVGAE